MKFSMRVEALALAAFVPLVAAHGYVCGFPVTRGQIAYGGGCGPTTYNNARGFPLVGTTDGGATRPDPYGLAAVPEGQRTHLQVGTTNIVFAWGDGADHPGPCVAYLGSRSDTSLNVTIGQADNCAQDLYAGTVGKGTGLVTPSFLTVTIPSGYEKYNDLFIQTQVEAHHLANANGGWEQYRDIMDISLDNSASNQIPGDVISEITQGWSSSAFAAGLKMNNLPSGSVGGAVAAVAVNNAAVVVPAVQQKAAVDVSSTSAAAAAPAQPSAAAPAPDNSNNNSTPAPAPAPAAAGGNCFDLFEQCNINWMNAGADAGHYGCQNDFVSCQAASLKRSVRVHRAGRRLASHA